VNSHGSDRSVWDRGKDVDETGERGVLTTKKGEEEGSINQALRSSQKKSEISTIRGITREVALGKLIANGVESS